MASTIGEILPEAARRFGDKTALIVENDAFSFSELESMSSRVANGLWRSVCAAWRYGPNSWGWIVAYYAKPGLRRYLRRTGSGRLCVECRDEQA